MLDEKHLVVVVTQPRVAALLAGQGWDGAVRPGEQDFLYLVESNVGFNKANAGLQHSIQYEVDLTSLDQPTARLTVQYALPATLPAVCEHIRKAYGAGDYQSETQTCYWNYLRVYTPPGADLRSGTPWPTPGEWMWDGQARSGSVVQSIGEVDTTVFSQFFVVPSGGEAGTTISYSLPRTVVHYELASQMYCLSLQKQAGTEAVPVRVQVGLPPGSQFISAQPAESELDSAGPVFNLALNTDQVVCVTFARP